MTAVLAACVVLAAKSEGTILFAAHRVDYSDPSNVRYTSPSRLFLYDPQTGSIRRLIESSQDLIEPAALDSGRILYVSHDAKSNGNSLIFYDLKSRKRFIKTAIPDGTVRRITVLDGGKYLEVRYRRTEEHAENSAGHITTHITILKGTTVMASYSKVVDASVDPQTGRVAVISPNGKLSFEPPNPFGTPEGLQKTSPLGIVFGVDQACFFSYAENVGWTLSRSKDPFTLVQTVRLQDMKSGKQTPTIWLDYFEKEIMWLQFDSARKRVLLHGFTPMSSGGTWMTAVVRFDAKQLDPLCMGDFVFEDMRGRVYSVDYSNWVGTYHGGGLAEAKLFQYSADGATKKELTSDSYDVKGACWLEGVR